MPFFRSLMVSVPGPGEGSPIVVVVVVIVGYLLLLYVVGCLLLLFDDYLLCVINWKCTV
jgi:hypothetical protein